MERVRGTAIPHGRGPTIVGSTGIPAQAAVAPMERLRRTAAPIGAGPPLGGTGSPAQAAVDTYGARIGDGCAHCRGPTKLEGRRLQPRRRSVPMECMWGTAASTGPGQPARGTGSPAEAAVIAYV